MWVENEAYLKSIP